MRPRRRQTWQRTEPIFAADIFGIIENLERETARSGWWMQSQIDRKRLPVYGCEIKNGKYYDTGNKTEYLKTVIEFALTTGFSKDIKEYIKGLKLD